METFASRCAMALPACIMLLLIHLVPVDLIPLKFQNYLFWSAVIIAFSLQISGVFAWWSEYRSKKALEFDNPNVSGANKSVNEK